MRIDQTPHRELREGIDIAWIKLLKSMKFEAVLLSSYGAKANEAIDNFGINSLILTGGNDVTVEGETFQRERNDFEISLLQAAIDRGIPTIGVCRGMQIMNLFYGGTVKRAKGHVGEPHLVNFDGQKMSVNSFHNFAIDRLGGALDVLAQSEDGCIEAFRHKVDHTYGVMWHPERPIDNAEWHRNWLRSALCGELV